jgi:hypothetical protein
LPYTYRLQPNPYCLTTMPHYDRHADPSAEQNQLADDTGPIDEADMEDAAEAIREVEVKAVRPEPDVPDPSSLDANDLEQMSIDDLRVIAQRLDIPDRSKITEQDELVAEIRKRLPR